MCSLNVSWHVYNARGDAVDNRVAKDLNAFERGFFIGVKMAGSSVIKGFSTGQCFNRNCYIGLKSLIGVQLG